MNIANIFGLHLGCRIKFKQSSSDNYTGIGRLSAVKNGWVEISVEPDDTRLWYDCSDCKLLLKPLSKITDEDKAEFLNEFAPNKPAISHMGIECGIVYATYIDSTGELNYVDLNLEQSLWLATMGFDIGIVPDEYKEVEE